MAIPIHIVLDSRTLDPGCLSELSGVPERYGIDPGRFLTARIMFGGLSVEPDLEGRQQAS